MEPKLQGTDPVIPVKDVRFDERHQRFMRELRCVVCHTLLAMEYVFVGRLQIKCKCGHVNDHTFKARKSAIKEAGLD